MTKYVESNNLALVRFDVDGKRAIGVIELRYNSHDVDPYTVKPFNVVVRKDKTFSVTIPTEDWHVRKTRYGLRTVRKRLKFNFNIKWMCIDG